MYNEFDRDIEIAFKSRGLKKSMKKWDREIRIEKVRPFVTRLAISVTAIAVALLPVFFFIPLGWQASSIGKAYLNENIGSYQAYGNYRGNEDEAQQYVADAYNNLCSENYSKAAGLSQKAIRILRRATDDDNIGMLQDAEWYNALANLSRGQLHYVLKAKRDLNKIARGNGKHKDEAIELLNRLK